MSDEDVRALERDAVLSHDAARSFTKELRRLAQAFENCDWCWGAGFRILMGRLERCSWCSKGEPRRPENPTHIADEINHNRGWSHWRPRAAARIIAALEALPKTATEKDCRAALRRAYPFGQRAYHPYKVWCDEVKKQLTKRFGKELPTPLLDRPRLP